MPFPASQMISHPGTAAPGKIPRDRFEILRVEAELCPHVVRHVLDIVARYGILPFTIMVQRHPLWQVIETEIAELPGEDTHPLLLDLRRCAHVRSVTTAMPKRCTDMSGPRKF